MSYHLAIQKAADALACAGAKHGFRIYLPLATFKELWEEVLPIDAERDPPVNPGEGFHLKIPTNCGYVHVYIED